MKRSAWTYIGYYLLVYVVLAFIYGLAQKHFVCIKIDGYECNFNETKFIGFLTIIAYIITPIVAIFGFFSWKDQHNQNIDSKYYDQALERFKKISTTVRKFKTLYEECNYISINGRDIDILYFQEKYKDNKNELLLNLDIFHSELIFLQNLNQDITEKSKIESIFNNYIQESKTKLDEKDIIHNFYNSYTDYEEFEEDLRKSSEDQGKLIINNIKFIVDFLNSKIKVKVKKPYLN